MIIYDGTLSIFLQDKEPLAQKGIIPHSLACASQDDFSSLLCKVILSHCSSRSVLPPYSLRSLIATLNPTFQNWKFGTFFLLNLSDSEILTKVLHSSTSKIHKKKTCPLSYLNVEPFIVARSSPLTLSRNNKPLTPSSYKKVMI